MSRVKGLSFLGTIRYIRQNFGEQGFLRILDDLSEEDKKIVCGKFQSMEWYPQEVFIRFLSTADKILGKEEYAFCYSAGKANAEDTFGGIYKIFLEFGKPQTVIRKGPLAWRLLNDTGYLDIEVLKDNYVKGKIKEYENPHKCICWHITGYFEKVIELSGAHNVKAKEIKCRLSGDDCCEYEMNWE